MKRSPSGKARKGGLEIVYERRRGAIVSLRACGHAGFARAGSDIVCAAASALVLSAAQGLRRHCGARPKLADRAGKFRLDILDGRNARAQAVLETTVEGLEAIAASYPGHMKIEQAKPAAGRAAATGARPRRAKPNA